MATITPDTLLHLTDVDIADMTTDELVAAIRAAHAYYPANQWRATLVSDLWFQLDELLCDGETLPREWVRR
jgi:hypothetical protein